MSPVPALSDAAKTRAPAFLSSHLGIPVCVSVCVNQYLHLNPPCLLLPPSASGTLRPHPPPSFSPSSNTLGPHPSFPPPFRYLKAPPLRDINLITQRDGDGWVNCGVVYVQVGVMV